MALGAAFDKVNAEEHYSPLLQGGQRGFWRLFVTTPSRLFLYRADSSDDSKSSDEYFANNIALIFQSHDINVVAIHYLE
jgi:hypothetical protein